MNSLLYVYALCTVLLFVKMFGISAYQGYYRIKNKAFKNIEDAGFLRVPAYTAELPQVARAQQAWLNDLENIPIFWVLGALCIFLNTDNIITKWLFIIFTFSRVTHTLTYLTSMQPWRTISYSVGVLCLFVMASQIIYRVISF